MRALNDAELSTVNAVSRGVGEQILAATVARLYLAPGRAAEWKYQDKIGAVVLARNRDGIYAFHIIDLRDRRIVWSSEHDASFDYFQDKPFFHSFPSQADRAMAGFSFADESDAADFADAVARKKSLAQSPPAQEKVVLPPKPPVRVPPLPRPNVQHTVSASASVLVVSSADSSKVPPTVTEVSATDSSAKNRSKRESKKEGGGGGGGLFSTISKTKKREKAVRPIISAPSDFKHISHVGFDPVHGFEGANIPLEWRAIFEKAGITEEQLKNKKAAKAVSLFMREHAAMVEASKDEQSPATPAKLTSGPPEIPANSTRRPPPPPPPSHRPAPLIPPKPNVIVRSPTAPEDAAPTRNEPLNHEDSGPTLVRHQPPPAVPPRRQLQPALLQSEAPPRPVPAVKLRPPSTSPSAQPSVAPPPPPLAPPVLSPSSSSIPQPPPPPNELASPPLSEAITPPAASSVDARTDLMASIRNAGVGVLRKTEPAAEATSPKISKAPKQSLEEQLNERWLIILKRIGNEDEDESQERDSEERDSEWNAC
ncbi:hypothetical protein DFJ73DRAFT_875861 [Zopfochytrium polystomum]|nr:hypothetical protein DFJ73DRAFT_875861 [Zopfochytrium polystomum]